MLGLVLRHELKLLLRARRYHVLTLLCWVLLALALLTGWQQTRSYHASYASVMGRQQQMWERQGELNPHSATHQGLYAFKPWNPLNSWDPGLLPYLGATVFLESHKQNFDQSRAAQDQLRLSRFAPLTLSALFQVLIPLVVFLLAYGLISDERESGTLKMLLLQGLSPGQLFLGKSGALSVGLALMVVPPLLVGLVLMALDGPLPWGRLLVFGAVYTLYWLLAIWAGVLVSALAPDSRSVLLTLLGIWLLNVLVVPRAGLGWLQVAAPLPSTGAFQQAIQAEVDALPDWDARTERLTREQLAKYGVKTVAELPVSLEGLVLQASEEDDTRIHTAHFDRLYARYSQDSQRYALLGWLFPTVAVQTLSQALAATDFAHHQAFLAAAETYRQDYVGFLNRDIIQQPQQSSFEYTAGAALWKQIRPFGYRWPGVRAVLASQLQPLLALCLWVFGLVALTPWLLRRMRVLA